MKAVPAAGKTVTDHLVEDGKRFVEQFFRRRVRSRCDGEPTTSAYGGKLEELFGESVVLERTPRHERQANPAERAIRTLEEQVEVMRNWNKASRKLMFVAVVDTPRWSGRCAISNETNGATPYQDAYDSTFSSEHLPLGDLVLFHIPLPTSQNRTILR